MEKTELAAILSAIFQITSGPTIANTLDEDYVASVVERAYMTIDECNKPAEQRQREREARAVARRLRDDQFVEASQVWSEAERQERARMEYSTKRTSLPINKFVKPLNQNYWQDKPATAAIEQLKMGKELAQKMTGMANVDATDKKEKP